MYSQESMQSLFFQTKLRTEQFCSIFFMSALYFFAKKFYWLLANIHFAKFSEYSLPKRKRSLFCWPLNLWI